MSQGSVDFAALKDSVQIMDVVRAYGFQLRASGKEMRGRCMLPQHNSSEKNSFTVDGEKGAWFCWSAKCRKAHGGISYNILGLVMVMEGCTLYEAANRLIERYGGGTKKPVPQGNGLHASPKGEHGGLASNDTTAPAKNKPLGFFLKHVDYSHPYLASRGISRETAEHFGVGYFTSKNGKASMENRIVFPIMNSEGILVGYCGRVVDDSEPRYRFPAGFLKGLELWNIHRCNPELPLLIVEGFFGAMFLHQQCQVNVCSLMGCSLSESQEQLLGPFKDLWLALDNDAAGREATSSILPRLRHNHTVRVSYFRD